MKECLLRDYGLLKQIFVNQEINRYFKNWDKKIQLLLF